jgi:hypothetical protein
MNELAYCMHHSQDTWAEYDARGLYLEKVCDLCVKYKLSKYRPEVLTDGNYESHEPIEPDE